MYTSLSHLVFGVGVLYEDVRKGIVRHAKQHIDLLMAHVPGAIRKRGTVTKCNERTIKLYCSK
jgi:hypothetical protein